MTFYPKQSEIYNLSVLLQNGVEHVREHSPPEGKASQIVEHIAAAISAYFPIDPRVPGLVNTLIKDHLLANLEDVLFTIDKVATYTKECDEDPVKLFDKLEEVSLITRPKLHGKT